MKIDSSHIKLKAELLTGGIRFSEEIHDFLTSGGKPLSLKEYVTTSGLILRVEEEIFVNAPINQNNSKWVLEKASDRIVLRERKGEREYEVKRVPLPDYISKRTEDGIPFVDVGVTHTDRVRVSPIEGCTFNCAFCDLNLHPYRKKPIASIVETIQGASKDCTLPAKHVLISGGTPKQEDRKYLFEVIKSLAKEIDLPIDIMMVPPSSKNEYLKTLYDLGINGLSINIELFNKKYLRRYVPEKAIVGREYYLKFIETAVEMFGKGRVQSLLIVGLEPLEDTLEGVKALSKIGCIPVLSPFIPPKGKDLEKHPHISADDLIKTYYLAQKIARENGVFLGPKCIPCQHNTMTLPDGDGYIYY